MTSAVVLIGALLAGLASILTFAWKMYNAGLSQGKADGGQDNARHAQDALDDIREAVEAGDAAVRDAADPSRLREDDGFKRP